MLPQEIGVPPRPLQPQPPAVIKPTADHPEANAMDISSDGSTEFPTSRKRSAQEGLDDEDDILNPSVMIPYITKVGEVPRKVQIERRKRLYALQNITELLDDEGFAPKDIHMYKGTLPLQVFDNTDYETRKPSQWVDKVQKIPAHAACMDVEGKCVWKECEVLDYAEDGQSYLVQWNDTGQSFWIPRIFLHFKAESPFIFVKRFAEAYRLREKGESIMKYNLYVDSMPKEDIPPLRPEQEEHIRILTLTVKEFQDTKVELGKYMDEVNSEYARVMNQIVLDDSLKNQRNHVREFTVEIDMEFIEKAFPPAPL